MNAVRFETGDLDEASDVFERSFPGFRLRRSEEGRPFHFSYSRDVRDGVALNRVRITGRADGLGVFPDHIAVGHRRSGRVETHYGSDTLDTTVPYLRPFGSSFVVFEDSDSELITLDPLAFQQAADRVLEGSGRRLLVPSVANARPMSAASTRIWESTTRFIRDSFRREPGATEGLMELLAVTLLSTFPLSEEAVVPAGTWAAPQAVRRAQEFLDARAPGHVSVAAAAEYAGLSVRALQAGFRRHLDRTPTQYLREARLRAARAELQGAGSDDTHAIAEIAFRAGFSSPARFAAAYREQFGEQPATTLGGSVRQPEQV